METRSSSVVAVDCKARATVAFPGGVTPGKRSTGKRMNCQPQKEIIASTVEDGKQSQTMEGVELLEKSNMEENLVEKSTEEMEISILLLTDVDNIGVQQAVVAAAGDDDAITTEIIDSTGEDVVLEQCDEMVVEELESTDEKLTEKKLEHVECIELSKEDPCSESSTASSTSPDGGGVSADMEDAVCNQQIEEKEAEVVEIIESGAADQTETSSLNDVSEHLQPEQEAEQVARSVVAETEVNIIKSECSSPTVDPEMSSSNADNNNKTADRRLSFNDTAANSDDDQLTTTASAAKPTSSSTVSAVRQLQPLIAIGDGEPLVIVEVISGERRALLHVDKLNDVTSNCGVKPPLSAVAGDNNNSNKKRSPLCVQCLETGLWMTPNQFQRSSGRGTARDWKRSMKHNGYSLKSLQRKNILSLDVPPFGCRCCYCVKAAVDGNAVENLSTSDRLLTLSWNSNDDGKFFGRKRHSTDADLDAPSSKQVKVGDGGVPVESGRLSATTFSSSCESPRSGEEDSTAVDGQTVSTDAGYFSKEQAVTNIIRELRTKKRQLSNGGDDNNNVASARQAISTYLKTLSPFARQPSTAKSSPNIRNGTTKSSLSGPTSLSPKCSPNCSPYDDSGALDLSGTITPSTESAIDTSEVPLDLRIEMRKKVDRLTEKDRRQLDTMVLPTLKQFLSWPPQELTKFIARLPKCREEAARLRILEASGSIYVMWNIDKYMNIMHMPRDTAEAIRHAVDRIIASSMTPWKQVESEVRKTQERMMAMEWLEATGAVNNNNNNVGSPSMSTS